MQNKYKERTITCEACGTTVTKRMPQGRRFCTLTCYRTSKRPERMTGVNKACEWCSVEFYVRNCRAEIAQFCSKECTDAWQGRHKIPFTCKMCKVSFLWSPSRASQNVKYCSIKCRDKDPDVKLMLLKLNAEQQDGKINSVEKIGYNLLDSLNVEYSKQELFNSKFTPDATIVSHKLLVQFDGDYWHDKSGTSVEKRILKRVSLDKSQDAYATACGWRVVRLWESDLKSDPDGCLEVLANALTIGKEAVA